jgi:hypothetical protein
MTADPGQAHSTSPESTLSGACGPPEPNIGHRTVERSLSPQAGLEPKSLGCPLAGDGMTSP